MKSVYSNTPEFEEYMEARRESHYSGRILFQGSYWAYAYSKIDDLGRFDVLTPLD